MTTYHMPDTDSLPREELLEHLKLAYKWLKEAEPAINAYNEEQDKFKTMAKKYLNNCGLS